MTAVRRVLFSLLVITLALAAVACGNDDGEDTGGAPSEPSSPSGGSALTVGEALEAGGTVTVRGTLFVSDAGGIELCDAILESFPPQCGEPSVQVAGLDLSTIELESSPDGAVSWAEGVELAGRIEDGELRV